MARPQEAAKAAKSGLQALAKSGNPEAADHIRQHLASPALAHFSVRTPDYISQALTIFHFGEWLALYYSIILCSERPSGSDSCGFASIVPQGFAGSELSDNFQTARKDSCDFKHPDIPKAELRLWSE